MNLIQRLMGRRQFLIAAGMASTCALTCKKFTDFIGRGLPTGIAMAAEKAGTADIKTTTNKYPHFLSPLKVRNRVLKNRIYFTPATPMKMQGPEKYPADQIRSFYSDIAKNAAIVTLRENFGEEPGTWEDIPTVQEYIDQTIEDIHCEGALVCCGRIGGHTPGMKGTVTEDAVTTAKKREDKGYDVIEVGERSFTGVEAVRAVLKDLEAVRKATNILIMAAILPFTPGKSRGAPEYPWSPEGAEMEGPPGGQGTMAVGPPATGPEMEEVVEMAKMLEGLVDIIRMKDCGHATNHPNSFSMEKGKPWMLPYSQAIKESGNKIIICPTGGFHDPALNEEWIASGKADMVGMATPLIADPEFVKKCNEGRPEDIIVCVSCHDCHNRSRTVGPHFTACTVNPKIGLITSKKLFIPTPLLSRKVAVIGGGPAGMKAAITAAERGHNVTLYEKSDTLGGLLRHTDFIPYKWTYRDFKDYLITQVKKLGINVQLKTTATPEMIKTKEYDTVLVATGAEPVVPKIQGADGKNVYNIVSVYRNKKSLGKNVVIVGGGLFSTETGCCLALEGYKVTVLTSGKQIPWALIQEEFVGSHNREIQLDIALNNPNFSYILEAIATRISEGKVFYKDSTGSEKSIRADSVVIYAGLKPRMDEAMKFSGSAGQVLLLGDCTGQAGTVQKTIRSAFFMASHV